jgi:hypothetical protein
MSTACISYRRHDDKSSDTEILCDLRDYSFSVHNNIITSSGFLIGNPDMSMIATREYLPGERLHRRVDKVPGKVIIPIMRPIENVAVTANDFSSPLTENVDYKVDHFGIRFLKEETHTEVDIQCDGIDTERVARGIGISGIQKESYDIDLIISVESAEYRCNIVMPTPFLYITPARDRLYIRSHRLIPS